jgi:hypothetical protein
VGNPIAGGSVTPVNATSKKEPGTRVAAPAPAPETDTAAPAAEVPAPETTTPAPAPAAPVKTPAPTTVAAKSADAAYKAAGIDKAATARAAALADTTLAAVPAPDLSAVATVSYPDKWHGPRFYAAGTGPDYKAPTVTAYAAALRAAGASDVAIAAFIGDHVNPFRAAYAADKGTAPAADITAEIMAAS